MLEIKIIGDAKIMEEIRQLLNACHSLGKYFVLVNV